ncbi:sec20 domain protein [Neofusicoccum parvum]|uniref:Sec20 domain protein n=1 Tax=Neofusicoccum parvum TaxID=310453 RepID=A0ACB5RPJ4_9PEZI|nr:sec20 domain protein [Neofusicoccum parvum]GME64702.1 sec20 domain protein [Neofusicoccum parvum]
MSHRGLVTNMTSPTSSLATRLASLSDQNKQTVQLIHRLAKLQFQPGSTPLDGEEGDVRVELSSEIHDSLKLQEEELELLRQEVDEITTGGALGSKTKDSERERDKSRLSIQVARLGEDFKQARSQFRKAQLQAKRNAEAAKQKERELLFAGIQEGNTTTTAGRRRGGTEKLTQDEIVANASSDVTAALRRTHQLMTSELSRSRFAQETLDQSTAALAELGEKYTDLSSLLANSKTLVNSLLRSNKSDTWYLETTLYILLTTITWLLFRRLLYGPLWWFAWLPLKFAYKFLFSILAAVGLAGGAAPTHALSSQAATLSSSSLIVQPSASNQAHRRMPDQQPHFVPAGAGGAGVKRGDPQQQEDPSQPGSVSQQVGQMAEAAAASGGDAPSQGEDVPRRGDGEPLVESDKPRNPKKRMWDENAERAKYEAQQQEEQQRQRDEL